MVIRILFFLVAVAVASQAQQREFGLLGGGGFLDEASLQGAAVPLTAGFRSGPAVGAWIGQDLYSHWSGEIRYLFEKSDALLRSGSTTAAFAGQAHVVHYDIVWNQRSRGERVRPYLAAGGGIKIFQGTGTETAYRPLMQYAYLTRTQELKPLASVGGGVKVRLGGRMLLRLDCRDQITPFPRKIVTPADGIKVRNWLNDLVPTIGVSWLF